MLPPRNITVHLQSPLHCGPSLLSMHCVMPSSRKRAQKAQNVLCAICAFSWLTRVRWNVFLRILLLFTDARRSGTLQSDGGGDTAQPAADVVLLDAVGGERERGFVRSGRLLEAVKTS